MSDSEHKQFKILARVIYMYIALQLGASGYNVTADDTDVKVLSTQIQTINARLDRLEELIGVLIKNDSKK